MLSQISLRQVRFDYVSFSYQQVEMSVSFGDDRVVGEEDGVGPALRPGQLCEDDSGHAT